MFRRDRKCCGRKRGISGTGLAKVMLCYFLSCRHRIRVACSTQNREQPGPQQLLFICISWSWLPSQFPRHRRVLGTDEVAEFLLLRRRQQLLSIKKMTVNETHDDWLMI